MIFDYDNPNDFVETPFILTFSLVYVANFFLTQRIERGHRHVCLLAFENGKPEILERLLDVQKLENLYGAPKNRSLGFCQKDDFQAIRQSIKNRKPFDY